MKRALVLSASLTPSLVFACGPSFGCGGASGFPEWAICNLLFFGAPFAILGAALLAAVGLTIALARTVAQVVQHARGGPRPLAVTARSSGRSPRRGR